MICAECLKQNHSQCFGNSMCGCKCQYSSLHRAVKIAEPVAACCKHGKEITQLGPRCEQCESEVNAGIIEGLNAVEKQPYKPYVTELVEDHGPRIDTVPFPAAPAVEPQKVHHPDCKRHSGLVEWGKCNCQPKAGSMRPEMPPKLLRLAEYIWNVRVTALEMPRLKDDFVKKVMQDLSEGIL